MSSSCTEAASSPVDTSADGDLDLNIPRRESDLATTSTIGDLNTEAKDSDTISKTVHIDQYGDLKLIVGEEKVCFIVCSRALARSAPFWNTLLYGPFAEAKPSDGNDWIVNLPEDHPGALEVILNLVHWPGHPEKITAIDLNLAFEVAVLTDKYSMTHCLASYARQWLEDLMPVIDHESEHWVPPIQWLFLTQELGDLNQYLTAFKYLAIRCAYRADGKSTAKRLMHKDPKRPLVWLPVSGVDSVVSTAGRDVIANLVGECFPLYFGQTLYDSTILKIPSLAEEINLARLRAVEEIKSFVRHSVAKLRKAAGEHEQNRCSYSSLQAVPSTICQAIPSFTSWKEKYDCDFSMLGLVTVWQDKSTWPLSEDEQGSVYSFHYLTVKAIKRFNKNPFRLRGQEHKHCTPFKSEAISMEKLERVVEDLAMAKSHYIGRHALLSGLDRGKGQDGSSCRKRTHQQMEQGTPTASDARV